MFNEVLESKIPLSSPLSRLEESMVNILRNPLYDNEKKKNIADCFYSNSLDPSSGLSIEEINLRGEFLKEYNFSKYGERLMNVKKPDDIACLFCEQRRIVSKTDCTEYVFNLENSMINILEDDVLGFDDDSNIQQYSRM